MKNKAITYLAHLDRAGIAPTEKQIRTIFHNIPLTLLTYVVCQV